jgi:hypothetical protein
VLAQGCGVGEDRGAVAQLHTLCRAYFGRPKCCVRATCVRDPGHCERLVGRRGSSSVPSYGASPRDVRGSPADCITKEKKSFCSVTTRRRNFRIWNGLRRGLGLLAAHSFCLGMLGLDLGILAVSSLPLCRLPAVDLSLAFRILTESLVPTPRLVLVSALFVQAGSRARAARSGLGTSLSFNVVGAHGRSVSQGKARGGCVRSFPGAIKTRTKRLLASLRCSPGTRQRTRRL